MASRAWSNLTHGNDDSIIYDAQRVQLAYDRINNPKQTRKPLFPSVQSYRKKQELRAHIILNNIHDPNKVVPDIHSTFGRTLDDHRPGPNSTFGHAASRARSGPSQYDLQNNPGIDLKVLPNTDKIIGGRISMHRPPNEHERHIIRSASMPGPNAYDYISKTWNTLKPGPKMNNSKSTSRIPTQIVEKEINGKSNMTYDKMIRPTLLGGYMSGKLERGPDLFSTPAPNAYDNATIPQNLRERIQGGLVGLPIEQQIILGPAPHDYQHPLKAKSIGNGLINPVPKGNLTDTTHGNWWEKGRGPGKYQIKEDILRATPKLTSMLPLPTHADQAHDRARMRGVLMAPPKPGPAKYYVNENQIRTWRTKGLGFGEMSALRELGKKNGDNNDVPYVNPPMPGVTNIYEGPGNRIGPSLGIRTALGVELEQMRRASEPSAQSYHATNPNGEKLVYKSAPSYTLGAKPFADDDVGPLSGPGPMTYQPSNMSTNVTGAWRVSVRGSNFTHRYNAPAATIHLPFKEPIDNDVPGPGEYLNLPDPIGNSDLPGALLGREMDPNADLKALMKRDLEFQQNVIFLTPKVGKKGNVNTIGGRINKYDEKKRQAIVRRCRLKMLKARRSSAATWNG